MAATRRRGAELEAAIREAVLSELNERGYAGATFESIAARAGTSKTVLYRRWPTKPAMVMAANMAAHTDTFTAPDTGDLATDIKGLLKAIRRFLDSTGRETMLMLLAELERSEVESMRTLLFARGAEILQPALTRARRRGELGDEELTPRVLSLPFDLVRHELVIVGTLDDEVIDRIVDEVVIPLFVTSSR